MINRRKTPDGLPFRLYQTNGKFKVSFGYKLPNGTWAFRLSAKANNSREIQDKKQEAIRLANEINGNAPTVGSLAELVGKYFSWQNLMRVDDARKKAQSTLAENLIESKNIIKVFGKMMPEHILPKHIYAYLSIRADQGAPAKANKEIALLSAVLEFGRMRGVLDSNPCRGIKYNPTKPRTKYVEEQDLLFAIEEARIRGGSYLVLALCVYTAYLTASRPTEMRTLARQAIKDNGLEINVAKRKSHEARKIKLIEWSNELRNTINEAIALQRTQGMFIFANENGQVYTRSGWNTIWARLMSYCEARAKDESKAFTRFTLADMRPKAVTDRKERGDTNIADATGHSSERMINQVYDRRAIKRSNATK